MRSMRSMFAVIVTALLASTYASASWAHSQSTALVHLADGTLQVDIALLDLEQAIGLDADGDGSITWQELRDDQARLATFVSSGVTLKAVEACPLGPPELLVDEHADGPYAVLRFPADCLRDADVVKLDYRLLFGINQSHRALVSWSKGEEVIASGVVTRAAPSIEWSSGDRGFWSGFGDWVVQGVWHIWTGYDHLLFLATLLLPAVVRRQAGQWVMQPSMQGALRDVIKVVTAFTLAHSISLIGGALEWLTPDSRWVESGIALTVLLGAVNLVFPMVDRRLWLVALGFGLVHGLGFASTLEGLGLGRQHLVRDLLGFNLGVELGQLAVIALVVPLAFSVRRHRWYREFFTPAAACAIGVVAAVWLVQRTGLAG